jgi:large subunit ribosomal protein L9
MELILTQDVDKIGKAGQVVNVKSGFGRNFLLPNRLAVPLTSENTKKLEQEKQRKAQLLEKTMNEALSLKARLEVLSLTIAALVKEEERLFGGIAAHDIASALADEGLTIDKNNILLEEPIKALGIYEVPVKLHAQVSAKVKVWVVKK